MSTSTARDADRAPDGLGVHWVRTFRQACRVAADRAYGFSVFRRSAPGLARAVWPWLWPVQMVGAGRQGSGIVVSGGASLALTGEPDQRPVWSAFMVGLFAYFVEIALIITPAVFGLTLAGLPGGDPDLAFALGWSLALGWRPLLLEMIAMTAALVLNPERLGTTRRRRALVKAGRYALTLDFLVRAPDAAKGAGQRPGRRPSCMPRRARATPAAPGADTPGTPRHVPVGPARASPTTSPTGCAPTGRPGRPERSVRAPPPGRPPTHRPGIGGIPLEVLFGRRPS